MPALVNTQGIRMHDQLRSRIAEIDRSIERLQRERKLVETRIKALDAKQAPRPGSPKSVVSCPKCGRNKDFLTDNGGYLGHVLEDPSDTEELEPGKPLFCPTCGEVFLFKKLEAVAKKRR